MTDWVWTVRFCSTTCWNWDKFYYSKLVCSGRVKPSRDIHVSRLEPFRSASTAAGQSFYCRCLLLWLRTSPCWEFSLLLGKSFHIWKTSWQKPGENFNTSFLKVNNLRKLVWSFFFRRKQHWMSKLFYCRILHSKRSSDKQILQKHCTELLWRKLYASYLACNELSWTKLTTQESQRWASCLTMEILILEFETL